MRKSTRSLRLRMFAGIAAVLLTMVIAFTTITAVQTYRTMRKEMSASMRQLAVNLSQQLDDEVRQLSLLTERIVFSSQLRETIINRLPQSEGAERYRQRSQLTDLMYSICGPKLTFYHANIITRGGYQFAFGQDYGYTRLSRPPEEFSWYRRAVKRDGKVLIVPLHQREIDSMPVQVISVCRGFGLMFGLAVEAVVEMQLNYDALADIVEAAAYPSNERDQRAVYVLDADGALVYPMGLSGEQIAHYYGLSRGEGAIQAGNPATGRQELIACAQGEYSGWRVVMAFQSGALMNPLYAMIFNTAGIGLALICAAALVSMLLSRRFTRPIQRLCTYVDNLRLDQLDEPGGWRIDSGVDELERLGEAFSHMTRRLNSSLDQVVELKNLQMHARMLALQAQMNPHFLYNTLAVITIMVENGETEQVQRACSNLSNTLEYISTEELLPVPLQDELQHTMNYMDLIMMRYQDDIEFTVDVPGDILGVNIPKLVIQPLVENAVKYATQNDPVWRVRLSASLEDGNWYVRVQDNGNGFDLDTLRSLREKVRLLRSGGAIPPLALNGMGIMNIFLRLYLTYGDEAIFWIDNRPGESACVTIGGRAQ